MKACEVLGSDRTSDRSALEMVDLQRRGCCLSSCWPRTFTRRSPWPLPRAVDQLGLSTAASGVMSARIEPGAQMLVESDQLVYDYDNNSVAAVGNVKIYYGQYTLEAEKVTYLQRLRSADRHRCGQADRSERGGVLFRTDRYHRRFRERIR